MGKKILDYCFMVKDSFIPISYLELEVITDVEVEVAVLHAATFFITFVFFFGIVEVCHSYFVLNAKVELLVCQTSAESYAHVEGLGVIAE